MIDKSPWFIRLREDFPWWKQLIWILLGEKQVGQGTGVKVTGFHFRGLTLVWKIESEDEYWSYPWRE